MNYSVLSQLNSQFANQETAKGGKPTNDVWASMNLDRFIRPEVAKKRLATREMMEKYYDRINQDVIASDFPYWLIPEMKKLKINGIEIKDFGGPGFTTCETGAIITEIAKLDLSVSTFFLVHNAIGTSVINILADEEQRARLLPDAIALEKICSFGLTEPDNGSDASGLKTTATKVDGGYLING